MVNLFYFPAMKNALPFILFLIIAGCSPQPAQERQWISLFNGQDLQGWETYLGPEYDPEKGDFSGAPIGVNRDPFDVFSVVEEDGAKALRISGEHFGGISTLREFENYHLQLQFKWGIRKYAPRDSAKRDSGILYHAHGPHAADWFFWMESQEFQVQEGDCGDYWGLNSDVDVPARMTADSLYVYDSEGELLSFGAHSSINRNVKKYPDDAENPTGQWNTLDLYTRGDTSIHVVNGQVVMVLYRSRQQKDSTDVPLTRGRIQIQSEGAEVFYRDIRMEPVGAFPDNHIASGKN